ncbi:MAG: PAS domain-containing protein [Methylocapsa sp.]|nr:PAS domain-containing protein [Methylocapsa sp.]
MRSEELAKRLEEAEETLRAIRVAAVDAFVVDEDEGSRVYMLETADLPHCILIEQMQQGAAILDAEGIISYSNLSLAEVLKIPHENLIGVPFATHVAAADKQRYQTLMRDRQLHPGRAEINLQRGDGTEVPARVTVSALARDRTGAIGLTVTDLTTERNYNELAEANAALRASEARLRAAEEHQQMLNKELTHRVKNALAVVQAIAQQTLRNASTAAEGLEVFQARLLALAKANDLLTAGSWKGADLQDLVGMVTSPFRDGSENSRIRFSGPQVWLNSKAVLALSLALHELATNAVKYGALSNSTGTAELSWGISRNGQERFQLSWKETGGPAVDAPRKRGFGARLIEQGLAQVDGSQSRLDFRPEGLVYSLDAPLTSIGGRGKIS